jgi:hypothetical protein
MPRKSTRKKNASGSGTVDDPLARQNISESAYYRFLSRGGAHGFDLEDWFEAEREFMDSPGRSSGRRRARK